MESQWHAVETNWSRDGLRLKRDNVRRCCRLQDRGTVQEQNGSRQHAVAHHRGGKEAQLARGEIWEYESFSGHKMRGPVGTGRGGVSMAGGLQYQCAWNGEGVRDCRLPSLPIFLPRIYLLIFCFLSAWRMLPTNNCSIYSCTFIFVDFIWFVCLSRTCSWFNFLYP